MAKQRKWVIWWWDKHVRRWYRIDRALFIEMGPYFPTEKSARKEANGRATHFVISRQRYKVLPAGKRPGKR